MGYIKKIIPERTSRKWFWFVMIVLLSFYPYKLANAYYPFVVSNIQTIFVATLLLIGVVVFGLGKKSLPSPLMSIVFIMIVGCFISFVLTGHKFYYHKVIIMLGGLMLLLIANSKVGMMRFYTLYNKWILLMAILGVIGFFLALVGVPAIYEFSSTEDSRTISSWIVTFTKRSVSESTFIRYAGFFDEPGAMGYWGSFALAINRLFIKDGRLEKLLIVCLIFTFSMGYYSQILIFIVMLLLGRESAKRKRWWIAVAVVGISVMLATKGTKYDLIYSETIGRFEEASQGEEFMEGTSRENLTRESKEVFLKSPWLGMGWPTDDDRYIGDNPYETLAHDGIFGTIYLYFPFILLLYWSIRRRDYELFSMVVFLVAGFMHRPFHFNFLTFFVFYSIPLMYHQQTIKRKKKSVWYEAL